MGVLMGCLGWNGGAASLAGDKIVAVKQDTQNISFYKQKVCEFIGPYIVKRIEYLTSHLHYNFEQIVEWLELLIR